MVAEDILRRVGRLEAGARTQHPANEEIEDDILACSLCAMEHNGDAGGGSWILNLLRKPRNDEPEMIWTGNNVADMVKDRLHELQDILLINRW